MKKLLLVASAAVGVYLVVKKLNTKKNVAYAGDGIAANISSDKGGISSGRQAEANKTDKVILEDGGNEYGDTSGSVK